MPGAKRNDARSGRSQHFLRRTALAAELVAGLELACDDAIVEIGAGKGILTEPLARRSRHVIAVEIDPWLCGRLRERFGANPHVAVREEDFFETPLPERSFSVVGNLPFHRTSSILRRLTEGPRLPNDIAVIVQDGAALRRAGWPFAPESLQSLLLKPWWHVEVVRWIGRAEFTPPPSVDCALLWMARRGRPLVPAERANAFRDFVSAGFGREGNDLARNLRPMFGRNQLERLGRELHFSARQKPSTLDFSQWLGLFRYFDRVADESRRRRLAGARSRVPRRGRHHD